MAISESNQSALYYSVESAWAEIPGANNNMTELPITGETLKEAKGTVKSDRIRSDAQRKGIAVISADVAGDINFELIYSDFDAQFESVMRNAFTDVNILNQTDISANSVTRQFVGAASEFDSILTGTHILTDGFHDDANNGFHFVTAKSTDGSTLTVATTTLVTEGAGRPVTVKSSYVRNGVTDKSFLMERRHIDITQYKSFRGIEMATLTANFRARAKIDGTFGTAGERAVPSATSLKGSGTDTAASVNDFMTGSANIGFIQKDNVELTESVSEITVSVNTNPRQRGVLKSKYSKGIGKGWFDLTGTMELYFEDQTYYNDFVNHTPRIVSWSTSDTDGNVNIFTVPHLYFIDAEDAPSAGNIDIMEALDWDSDVHPTYGYTFQIERFANPD